MTTPHDPSDLASALVDGLLPADEAARAAADPGVAARAEEIRLLRAAVREVPPASDLARSRAVAAAVEAGMDASSRAVEPHETDEPHGARSGGWGWRPWLAAAAIVAVLVLSAGVLALRDGDGESETFASGTESAEEADGQQDTATADDSPEAAGDAADEELREDAPLDGEVSDADERTSAVTVTHLGAVDGERELVAAVAAHATRPGSAAAPSEPPHGRDGGLGAVEPDSPGDACSQLSPSGDPERGASSFVATAVLEGESVWVHVYPASEGRAWLVATNDECTDVVDRVVALEP